MEPTDALPGAPVEIDSESDVADAYGYEARGVSLQVPSSLTMFDEEETEDGLGEVVQTSFGYSDSERAALILTVENLVDGDEKDAEFSALTFSSQLSDSGIASDIERSVLDWPEIGVGAAVSAELSVELNGQQVEHDTLTVIIAHKERLVTVSIEAEKGEIAESDAMRALRSLRIEV